MTVGMAMFVRVLVGMLMCMFVAMFFALVLVRMIMIMSVSMFVPVLVFMVTFHFFILLNFAMLSIGSCHPKVFYRFVIIACIVSHYHLLLTISIRCN